MTTTTADPFSQRLFEAATTGDVRTACALVAAQAEAAPLETLLTALAATQSEVGEGWAANRFTIADEHRASAVIDAALGVVERLLPPPKAGATCVTLVCAEREWHTLPARLAAAWLRLGGANVDFLGGSLPAPTLAADLGRRGAELVAVSCSVPDQLFGARRTIAAATAAGVPALAGGAAFGRTDLRARRIGAAAWARGGADIVGAAEQALAAGVAPPADPRLELQGLEVVSHGERLVSTVVDELRRRFPQFLVPGSAAEDQTIADVRSIVRFAAAAVLVDDETVFTDFIGWLIAILSARHVPVSSLDAALEALEAAEPPDVVRPVLAAGRARIVARA